MKAKLLYCMMTVLCASAGAWQAQAQLTWTQCQEMARAQYPLLRQYRLVEQSTAFTVANAARAWLPQVSLSAQATWQNDVAAFPEQMKAMFQQIGSDVKGLNKDQYRAAIDVSQTVWDGGLTRAAQGVTRAEGDVSQQQLEVEMYALRERVSQLYFGILTLRAQLRRNDLLHALLLANLHTAEAAFDNGVATEADLQTLKAECLAVAQQRLQIESAESAFRKMLELMTGRGIGADETLEKPAPPAAEVICGRPELRLFDAQERQVDAQERALYASLRPRLGLFVQGFYGNPGYNLFKDMTENRWTWNYMAGVRLQWSVGGLYTKKGNLQKLAVARLLTDSRREVFLYNQRLQQAQQTDAAAGMRRVMAGDDEIIVLRTAIRKTAEAKLAGGTLTAADLLRDITSESQALLARDLHELEWLLRLCELSHTMN
jgi:outer membrane protein TolC